jgi:hypothetical protein
MPKNKLPSPDLVAQFALAIDRYSRPVDPAKLSADALMCDLHDLNLIFKYFVAGDQVSANGCLYRLCRDVRNAIPPDVRRFIAKHS